MGVLGLDAAHTCSVSLIVESVDGQPLREVVPATHLAGEMYRVDASPGFVPGIATGDVIELCAAEVHGFRVISRGGNVCVQVFSRSPHPVELVNRELQPLRGRVDGGHDSTTVHLLILTISVSSGFAAIEDLMRLLGDWFQIERWMYGNVYDPADGVTPLNWWR